MAYILDEIEGIEWSDSLDRCWYLNREVYELDDEVLRRGGALLYRFLDHHMLHSVGRDGLSGTRQLR